MRIPSGVTDQYIYFVAVDATDFTTRETSLTTPTVYRSRNNGTATAMTTPTIAAVDATNMPGVFSLLLDEDMTIGAGNDSEEMVFHIDATEMAPVTRTIELYRRTATAGETLTVTSGLASANTTQINGTPQTANDVGGDVNNILIDTGTTLPGTLSTILSNVNTVDSVVDGIQADLDDATNGLTAIKNAINTVDTEVGDILVDTGTTLPGTLSIIDGIVDEILTDTGTTLPATLTTIEGKIDTVDGIVDNKEVESKI